MDFMAGLKERVRQKHAGLLPDVEALSCSILLLLIGSGLDRSSPTQETRCLQGCKAEEGRRAPSCVFQADSPSTLKFMNKRGQFFLIAALVIAGIIITLTTINISTRTSDIKTTAIYDLSKEIDYESSSLIDYGVYNPNNITGYMNSLMANYSAANPNTDIVFVYGNFGGDTLTGTSYFSEPIARSSFAGAGFTTREKKIKQVNGTIDNKKVNVTLSDNSTISFNLKSGENFFIVLKMESGEETIVAKNQNE